MKFLSPVLLVFLVTVTVLFILQFSNLRATLCNSTPLHYLQDQALNPKQHELLQVIDNRLVLLAPVLALPLDPQKHIILPEGVKKVWIDVGTHEKSSFMSNLEKDPSLFIIGFEPQPDLACHHEKHDRLIIFQAALADNRSATGLIAFNLWSSGGASILPHAGVFASRVGESNRQKKVVVPIFPLDFIYDYMPPGVEFEYLKVDAQGADYLVLRGGTKFLKLLRGVTVECQDVLENDSRLYYEGACRVSVLLDFMKEHGFFHHACWLQNPEIVEQNCHFGKTPEDLQFVYNSFS